MSLVSRIRHKFASVIPDQLVVGPVKPSHWNDDHQLDLAPALIALDALTPAANKIALFTAIDQATLLALAPFVQSLFSAADAGAFRSALALGNVDNTSDANKPVSTAMQAALNLKANLTLRGQANGLASLGSDGKIPSGQLPAIAIGDVYEVASQAAMLALGGATIPAEQGDIAVRSDINKTFILKSNSPATLADWVELKTPTDVVLSVAGLTGSITASSLKTALALVAGDISGFAAVATSGAYADLTGKPSLGTAAPLNVGTGANQVVQLDGTGKMPAVDGSQLTNLPSGLTAATAAEILAGTQVAKAATPKNLADAEAWVALTDAATIAVDGTTGINFKLASMAGNRTLGNFTNPVVGRDYMIAIKQDGTGTRTLAYGSHFGHDGDTVQPIGTTANKWSILGVKYYDATHAIVQLIAVNTSAFG